MQQENSVPRHSPFSKDEFLGRVERTVAAMNQQGLDALVAYANTVAPGHVRYLSGYETHHGIHDASFFVLTPTHGSRFTLITNVSWEDVPEITWVDEVMIRSDFDQIIPDLLSPGARNIGIAGYKAFPAPVIRRLLGRFPSANITDASQLLLRVRMVKSPAEVAVIRRCAEITDAGGQAFLDTVQEGRSEREVLVAVEGAMKLEGSDEVSFATQVGAGPRTVKICCYATDQRMANGDIVSLDCGATYLGYHGDLSRMMTVGTVSAKAVRFLEATADMYDRCLEAIRPGVPAAAVARAGVAVSEAHGLRDFLYSSPNVKPGFMGHGIGTSYHEIPMIDLSDNTELQENMVLVLEPILKKEGLGGVKIEDAVVVTSSGAERFSRLPIRPWRSE